MEAKESSNKDYLIATINVVLCTVAFFLVLNVISSYLPDTCVAIIKKELRKQGYCVCGIDFEFVNNGERYGERIYQSSEPIYYKGNYISQWVLEPVLIGAL